MHDLYTRSEARTEGARLFYELSFLADNYLDQANFLLVRPSDAHRIAADLLRQGLAVRSYPTGLLRDWLRITVRARAENDRLLEALGSMH